MKRLITILFILILHSVAFGQNNTEGIIKFLGIPIDGNKQDMYFELKEKGFIYNRYSDSFSGQFNGRDVTLYVDDNHGVVDRVCVVFPITNRRTVIQEFNDLLSQFESNKKYIASGSYSEIPSNENLAFEMTIHNKIYSARFNYISPDLFTAEEVASIRQEVDVYKNMTPEERQQFFDSFSDSLGDSIQLTNPQMDMNSLFSLVKKMTSLEAGQVWFTIIKLSLREYQVALYYDNLLNRPHGEDL